MDLPRALICAASISLRTLASIASVWRRNRASAELLLALDKWGAANRRRTRGRSGNRQCGAGTACAPCCAGGWGVQQRCSGLTAAATARAAKQQQAAGRRGGAATVVQHFTAVQQRVRRNGGASFPFFFCASKIVYCVQVSDQRKLSGIQLSSSVFSISVLAS